jgi:hypothetical protein
MDNPETLATQSTQDEEKGNKNTTQLCVGHHYVKTNTINVNKKCTIIKRLC